MASYETKALLLSVLRYTQKATDKKEIERFIEELLIADGYVPDSIKEKDSN